MEHIDKSTAIQFLVGLVIFWLCVLNGIIWFHLLEGWFGIVWLLKILIGSGGY